MFAKFKAFFSGLFAKFSPVVTATLTTAASNIALELGTIGMNILLAKAGQLTADANVKYIGKDGSVKMNAVRDELLSYAKSQAIPVSQSALNWLIENAHTAQTAPVPS